MASTVQEKRPTEIIELEFDFTSALQSGEAIQTANVSIVCTNKLTDVDVTASILVSSSTQVSGAVISCQVQNGSDADLIEVRAKTGLTNYANKYEGVQDLLVTLTPSAENLLCNRDEVKTRLKIATTDTSDDVLIDQLIGIASDYFRHRTGRSFAFQKYTQTIILDEDDPRDRLYLAEYPIYAVDSITLREVYPQADTTYTDATLIGFSEDGIVWFNDGSHFYTHPYVNIVVYRGGFKRVPNDIRGAVQDLAVWFYRLATKEGLKAERIGDYSYTLQSLGDVPSGRRYELPVISVEAVVRRYQVASVSLV